MLFFVCSKFSTFSILKILFIFNSLSRIIDGPTELCRTRFRYRFRNLFFFKRGVVKSEFVIALRLTLVVQVIVANLIANLKR